MQDGGSVRIVGQASNATDRIELFDFAGGVRADRAGSYTTSLWSFPRPARGSWETDGDDVLSVTIDLQSPIKTSTHYESRCERPCPPALGRRIRYAGNQARVDE